MPLLFMGDLELWYVLMARSGQIYGAHSGLELFHGIVVELFPGL